MPILTSRCRSPSSQLRTKVESKVTTIASALDNHGERIGAEVARKLVDILRAMPEGEVALTLNDKRMTVQSGKSRFALQTLAAGWLAQGVQLVVVYLTRGTLIKLQQMQRQQQKH